MNTGKTGSSLFILYDQLRWEEKAIIESAKKKGIDIGIANCRDTIIDLEQNMEYSDRIMIQRCVSYYNNVHSTAAIEGLGATVINSLQTAIYCGNKLFSHMELRKAGVPVPRAFCAFSQESALIGLGDTWIPKSYKTCGRKLGETDSIVKGQRLGRSSY